MRILVAEDERINQLYMSHLLSDAGHEPVVAGDGREAIDKLAAQPCDVVLMDLQMPGIDGVEATRRIRAGEAGEDRADVPIIALTAYASDDDHRKQANVGIDWSLSKPVNEQELLALLEEARSRE
ncbi:MAG: response regulator [Spirochaetota bacterium]